MTTLTIAASSNFLSGLPFPSIDLINFTNTAAAADALFRGSQFDNVQIFNDVVIDGTAGQVNSIAVFMSGDLAIDASGWIFADWTDGEDLVVFNGSSGGEVITGSIRNDAITGGTGNDTLSGGLGDDTFRYNSAAEIGTSESVDGGGGTADSIVLAGSNTLYSLSALTITSVERLKFNFGGSTATLSETQIGGAAGRINTMIGSTGIDTLTVMGSKTDLSALTFEDWSAVDLVNLTGNVTVANTLTGSSQNDTITGGGFDDSLRGRGGADALFGGGGDDFASYFFDDGVTTSLDGSVTQTGAAAGDTYSSIEHLSGSDTGNDKLSGNTGVNRLNGNGGNDTLNGLGGADTLSGGEGDDSLRGGDGGDTLNGGNGQDFASYFFDGAVTTSLDGSLTQTGAAAGDTYSSVEHLSGSDSGDDTLSGNAGANRINGNGGGDTLNGLSGADTLSGGEGDDSLRGGAGGDVLNGGNGQDFASYFFDGAVTTSLDGSLTRTGAAAGDSYTSIEHLSGSNTGGDTLKGNSGANRINGNGGNDILTGAGGADTLNGNAGDDTFIYAAGDLVVGESINGGADTDTLQIGNGAFDFFTFATMSGIERFAFANTSGSASVVVRDTQMAAAVTGSAGENAVNIIKSATGALDLSTVSFTSWSADDLLSVTGTTAGEVITGSAFSDFIEGGDGADTLNGGGGDDIFFFTNGQHVDAGEIVSGGGGTNDRIRVALGLGANSANFRFSTVSGVEGLEFASGGSSTNTALFNASSIGGANITQVSGSSSADGLSITGDTTDLSGITFTGWSNDDNIVFIAETAGGSLDWTGSSEADTFQFSTPSGANTASISGGGGNDLFSLSDSGNASTFILNGGAGSADKLMLTGAFTADFTLASITGIEVFEVLSGFGALFLGSQFGTGGFTTFNFGTFGSSFQLTIAGATADLSGVTIVPPVGTPLPIVFEGGAGVNSYTGSSIADTMQGFAGNDVLNGLGGEDSLFGGDDDDSLRGGADGDFHDGGDGTDVASYVNDAAVDTSLDGSVTQTGAAAGDTYIRIENLSGSNTGDDFLAGDGNANELFGNGGDDTLQGRAGDDTLRGGTGADTLSGEAGADTFEYIAASEGGDIITSFSSIDFFAFKGSAFGGLAAGSLDPTRFVSRAADNFAQTATQRFIYQEDTDTLWFDANGSTNGAADAVLIANINVSAVVTAGDIVII